MTITDQYLKQGKSLERLKEEYNKHKSLVIGCDWDGTLYDYHKTGESYEQIRQLLRDLKEIGCKIVIWTAFHDFEFIKKYCEENNIPFDSINEGGIPLPWESKKPFFSALLDDRAGLPHVYEDLTMIVNLAKLSKTLYE